MTQISIYIHQNIFISLLDLLSDYQSAKKSQSTVFLNFNVIIIFIPTFIKNEFLNSLLTIDNYSCFMKILKLDS